MKNPLRIKAILCRDYAIGTLVTVPSDSQRPVLLTIFQVVALRAEGLAASGWAGMPAIFNAFNEFTGLEARGVVFIEDCL
jgi:hypothetical protein